MFSFKFNPTFQKNVPVVVFWQNDITLLLACSASKKSSECVQFYPKKINVTQARFNYVGTWQLYVSVWQLNIWWVMLKDSAFENNMAQTLR